MKKLQRLHSRKSQRGATLLLVMMLLVMAGLLAITAASMGTMDERVARNSRDQNVALQAAEAALRDARTDVFTSKSFGGEVRAFYGATGATANCNASGFKGVCTALTHAQVMDRLMSDTQSVEFGEVIARPAAQLFADSTEQGGVTRQPRYIVEVVPDPDDLSLTGPIKYVYRVTAIGFGSHAGTRSIVQEVVRVATNS